MILLFPSKGNLIEGQSIPLIQIPLSLIKNAQKIELNDFQWVAKTSDWESWIKKNPRSYQAESEVFEEIHSFPHHREIKRIKTFDEYTPDSSIFEEEIAGDKADADAMIKFLKVRDSLNRQGKIDKAIEFEGVPAGEANAWFLSLTDEDGKEAPETEMAYKIIRKYTSGGEFAIYSLEEIQPLNQKVGEGDTFQIIFEKTTNFLKGTGAMVALALSGFVVLKSIGGVYSLFSQYSRVRKFTRGTSRVRNYKSALSYLKGGGKWAFKGLKNTAKLLQGVAQGFGKGFKWGKQGYRFSRSAGKARSLALGNSFKSFGRGFLKGVSKFAPKTAAEAVPVIGWIIGIADVAQQTYNWFSDNQAPRFKEVESIAKDVFEPGKIPAGEVITLCWTQEGKNSNSWVGFLPMTSDDTRTTMDLAKVGDFDGSSLFILLNIGSKGLSQELMSNDINFIIFESGAKFEHGILDNDDLVFKVASIEKASDAAQPMVFHGICPWDTFSSAFADSSADLVVTDPQATEDFKFNFQNGDTRVNVTGTLVSKSFIDLTNPDSGINRMIEKGTSGDVYGGEPSPEAKSDTESEPQSLPSEETPESTPAPGETPAPSGTSPSESRVLSFSDFMLAESQIFEAEDAEAEMDFKTQNVAIYRATAISNVDENATSAPPKFSHFIVGDDVNAWRAKTGDPIDVASDEADLEDTRKGHADPIKRYSSEWLAIEDSPEPTEAPNAFFLSEPEEEKAQSYVLVDDDELKIKYKDDKQKIKDIKAGGFNLLKELTTEEERKELGIEKWEELDVIKLKGNPLEGESRKIKLREKGSFGGIIPNGEKRTFTPKDGRLFNLALSIFNRMKNKVRIK
jgi:hypothetical protein